MNVSLSSLPLLLSALMMGLGVSRAQLNSSHPFPKYSYLYHPTYTLAKVLDEPTPVIMHEYFFRSNLCCDRFDSEGGMFAPGGANYTYQHSTNDFAVGADVLYTPATIKSLHNEAHFATIRLNRPAFVYLLLTVDNPFPAGTTSFTIESTDADVSVPADWTAIAAVEHKTSSDYVIGDEARWNQTDDHPTPYLSRYAAVVTATLSPENEILLPHPKNFRVNGQRVRNFLIIMAESAVIPLVGHPKPAVPGNFFSYLTGEYVQPAQEPPIPNQPCPSWLHDTYVTKRHNVDWETWHPPIDNVYWCYFNHEHGSYPGLYRPRFHYTAYHTPDPSVEGGRQIESHNGFKVYSFVVDDGRVVVMVLHAEMSKARRFHARHHTFIFSVHKANDDGTWDMEMEIHMKADFGPLRAINSNDPPLDEDVENEMIALGQNAERDTYVYNHDNYPNSPFWINGDPNPTVEEALLGRYEEWRMPMNCGVNPDVAANSGFKFEFHEQQTAMKDAYSTAPDNLQRLSGDGMRRAIVFVETPGGHQSTNVSTANCVFLNGTVDNRANNGMFFTDAYFKYIVKPTTYGDFAMRQYIKKPFDSISVGGYRAVTNSDPWVGSGQYSPDMVPYYSNTEMATIIMDN